LAAFPGGAANVHVVIQVTGLGLSMNLLHGGLDAGVGPIDSNPLLGSPPMTHGPAGGALHLLNALGLVQLVIL
jgi:hypothetical protein